MPTFLLGDRLHIGGEIDTSDFNADSASSLNEVSRSFHTTDSGPTSTDLAEYLYEDALSAAPLNILRWEDSSPTIRPVADQPLPPEQTDLIVKALQIINEALPEDFQLAYDPALQPLAGLDTLAPPRETQTILVRFAPRESWLLPPSDEDLSHALGVTYSRIDQTGSVGRLLNSFIQVDMGRSSDPLAILIHELLHGLGRGHPGLGSKFNELNTIMDTVPVAKSGYVLYPLDTDALQAVYDGTLRREETYLSAAGSGASVINDLNDLGPWTQTGTQFLGRIPFPGGGGMVEFGAQLRNGHIRAFASGPEPQTDFVNNPANLGATWRGALSGFTYTGRPLQGTTRLDIDADLLRGNAVGDLMFRSLESFAPGGLAGTSTLYEGGSLDYRIEVRGNTFRETSRQPLGTEGRVDGAFFTRDHAAMGGVLQRSDARAGFGGVRQ